MPHSLQENKGIRAPSLNSVGETWSPNSLRHQQLERLCRRQLFVMNLIFRSKPSPHSRNRNGLALDVHHPGVLDRSGLGVDLEFVEQGLCFGVFRLFPQHKQLALPPIPCVHLNQLIEQMVIHRSPSIGRRLERSFGLSCSLYMARQGRWNQHYFGFCPSVLSG